MLETIILTKLKKLYKFEKKFFNYNSIKGINYLIKHILNVNYKGLTTY